MAVSFEEWAQHYGYDPQSEQAREDYQRYLEEAEFAASLHHGITDADDQEPQQ